MPAVKVIDKSYKAADVLKDLSEYGAFGEKSRMIGALGICDDDMNVATENIQFIQRLYNKEHGKRLLQIMVSIRKYIWVNTCAGYKQKYQQECSCSYLIGAEISQLILENGFQNSVYQQEDTEYVHLHFIMNSINYMTGRKQNNTHRIGEKIEFFLRTNYREMQWEGCGFYEG